MLSFEPGVAIWTLITFFTVLIVLSKYVIPPLVRVVHDRKDNIAKDIENAANEARRAQQLTTELTQRLDALELERERILSESREKSRARYDELEGEMLGKLAVMRKQREEELEQEASRFLAATEDRINRLILLGCERVLSVRLTPEQQAEILENRICEFEKLTKL